MPDNVLPFSAPPPVRSARRPLLTQVDLRDRLGLSYENAYRILHAHGIRLGKRLYITEERLATVLAEERCIQ
jgi:hypothetical protein